ncbi:hypothetical protein F1880_006100 [Penicillium rolfsii]|nr:hypothetical protein F1880_006100 [Penicillium rolfsii]
MDPEQPSRSRYNFRRRKPTPMIHHNSSTETSPNTSREPSPAGSSEHTPAASPVAYSPEASSHGSSPEATPEASSEDSPQASPEPSPGPSTQPSVQYAAGARTRATTRAKRTKKAKGSAAKPQGVIKIRRPTRAACEKAPVKTKAGPALEKEKGNKTKAGSKKKEKVIFIGSRPMLAREREVNWVHDGSRIDDPDKLPDKWDPNEYDIDENDIDGNIERCYLRIEENILPKLFEERLERYLRRKAEKDEIIAAAPGLPWKVARRLHDLRFIEEDLAKNDSQEQMSNVRAIIAAYTRGQLKWKQGFVTFWSNGRMVWGPGKFDWKTFSDVNTAHQGHKSFWVEDLKIRLKIPGIRNPFASRCWDFVDDTGACSMNIFASDIAELERAANVNIQVAGHMLVATASGHTCMPAYHLQARLIDEVAGASNYMTPWTDIRVLVRPGGPSHAGHRLSGIWIRHLLYFANAPDNTGNYLMLM